jgi:hypothetical protein
MESRINSFIPFILCDRYKEHGAEQYKAASEHAMGHAHHIVDAGDNE